MNITPLAQLGLSNAKESPANVTENPFILENIKRKEEETKVTYELFPIKACKL